jgi:adenylate cyclase
MDPTSRSQLMNWLVSQGLTGLPENDLLRGFCERCRAGGLDLSRGLVFIDTLHPIFEGRGFRWNDSESNESETFEYGSTNEGDAARNWRRSAFHHLLETGDDEIRIDLADCDKLDFSMMRISPRRVTGISSPSCTASARPARWGRWIASTPIG